MRDMRIALVLSLAVLACAAQREALEARDGAPPPAKAAVEPAAQPVTAAAPQEAEGTGLITAAEAAAAYARSRAALTGGGGDASAAGECETDADCAFTRVAEGQCCPMLCAPRAVTKKVAQELESKVDGCNAGKGCPVPACRPPPQATRPACVRKRCAAQPMQAPADR